MTIRSSTRNDAAFLPCRLSKFTLQITQLLTPSFIHARWDSGSGPDEQQEWYDHRTDIHGAQIMAIPITN